MSADFPSNSYTEILTNGNGRTISTISQVYTGLEDSDLWIFHRMNDKQSGRSDLSILREQPPGLSQMRKSEQNGLLH
jgi:hypothetical protein